VTFFCNRKEDFPFHNGNISAIISFRLVFLTVKEHGKTKKESESKKENDKNEVDDYKGENSNKEENKNKADDYDKKWTYFV